MGQSVTNGSCIMFAGATTHCSNTCYKVQFRVELQSKYNFSGPLEIAVMWVYEMPTCSITDIILTFLLLRGTVHCTFTVRWQPNVFEL